MYVYVHVQASSTKHYECIEKTLTQYSVLNTTPNIASVIKIDALFSYLNYKV